MKKKFKIFRKPTKLDWIISIVSIVGFVICQVLEHREMRKYNQLMRAKLYLAEQGAVKIPTSNQ